MSQPNPAPVIHRPLLAPWRAALLLAGLILVCYWPALHGGILWDDAAHIPRPDLRSWDGLVRIWTDLRATQQYYPVLFSSFWVQHRLWGDQTFYYHLVNCLQHAASCFLFALILRRLWSAPATGSATPLVAPSRPIPPGTEWLAAAIFAVHPVCVESVAWITEQKNTLSVFFYLLAAYTYLRFADSRSRATYALATGCFLLALGSKSVTATLPPALLVVLWWRHGRLDWRRDVGPLLPWLALAVASGLFTAWVEHTIIGAGAGSVYALDATQRVLLAGRVVWFYLGKLIWPAELMFFYPRWPDPTPTLAWSGWLVGAVALTLALLFWQRRSRGPLAAWLLFVGALVPVLGLFNVYFFLFSYVADHFQYQACLPLIALLAAGLGQGWHRSSGLIRAAGFGLCAVFVAWLAFLTNQRSRIYTDNITHYCAIIAENPQAWIAYNNLGTVLPQTPENEPVIRALFLEAVRLNPDYAEAHQNLALNLARTPGREPEALRHYAEALRIFPAYPMAHGNLALLLARLPGREAEAIDHFRHALTYRPTQTIWRYQLAKLLEADPAHAAEARAHYEELLRLEPDHPGAREALAAPGTRPTRPTP